MAEKLPGEADVSDTPTPHAAALEAALYAALLCARRYERHELIARTLGIPSAALSARRHAAEARAHAQRLRERLVSLGSPPRVAPGDFAAHPGRLGAFDRPIAEVLDEDLAEERACVDDYARLRVFAAEDDAASRWVLSELVLVAEERAEAVTALLRALRQ